MRAGDGMMMLDDGGSDFVMEEERVDGHAAIGGSSARGQQERGERHAGGSSRPKR